MVEIRILDTFVLRKDKNFFFQGVIDAAVNGGIAKYQDAFFTPTFLKEFPSHLQHVAKLQTLMMDQVLKP